MTIKSYKKQIILLIVNNILFLNFLKIYYCHSEYFTRLNPLGRSYWVLFFEVIVAHTEIDIL